jgi:predicted transposase YbfD/YdcC
LTPIPPDAATRHRIVRRLDGVGCAAPLGAWAERVVARPPGGTDRPQAAAPAGALDGNTRRGSRTPGAPGGHRRSALAPQVDVTLAPQAGAEKPTALTAVAPVRGQMVLTGRVGTRAARLTPTAGAQTIVDAGGDDVRLVQANPPQRRAASERSCAAPPVGDHQATAATRDFWHGRLEPRRFTTRPARAASREWPGLAPGCALARAGIPRKTGGVRSETVAGVTRLASQRAAPSRVLERVRGHWPLAHQSHGVREVTCAEDRSQVRGGTMPQVRAALRTTTIGRLRWAGYSNMAAACRLFAAQPGRALALIGIQLEN